MVIKKPLSPNVPESVVLMNWNNKNVINIDFCMISYAGGRAQLYEFTPFQKSYNLHGGVTLYK